MNFTATAITLRSLSHSPFYVHSSGCFSVGRCEFFRNTESIFLLKSDWFKITNSVFRHSLFRSICITSKYLCLTFINQRIVVNDLTTSEICGCKFLDSYTTLRGGALLVDNELITLVVRQCLFLRCVSAMPSGPYYTAGGISVYKAFKFHMKQCDFQFCSALGEPASYHFTSRIKTVSHTIVEHTKDTFCGYYRVTSGYALIVGGYLSFKFQYNNMSNNRATYSGVVFVPNIFSSTSYNEVINASGNAFFCLHHIETHSNFDYFNIIKNIATVSWIQFQTNSNTLTFQNSNFIDNSVSTITTGGTSYFYSCFFNPATAISNTLAIPKEINFEHPQIEPCIITKEYFKQLRSVYLIATILNY